MKHAGASTLVLLEPLLREVRGLAGLVERTPGSFCRHRAGFLHFHEDPAGIFCDVKLDAKTWSRFRVSTPPEQALWLAALRRCLAQAEPPAARRLR